MIGSGADFSNLPEGSEVATQITIPASESVSGSLHPISIEPEESNSDKMNQCNLKASEEAAWEGANKIDSGDPLNFEDFINFEPEYTAEQSQC